MRKIHTSKIFFLEIAKVCKILIYFLFSPVNAISQDGPKI